MLQRLFKKQQEYIDAFFSKVNLEDANRILDTIFECRGMLIFSGVGKSGIIAEKLAMTMISLGTKALYMPPMNALHGDIGVVSEDDVFILISKSGQTVELANLLPAIKKKGAKTIAWISQKDTLLEKRCDCSIYLPVDRELCPFDLAPTTSTAIQLIFGDILAIALMEKKQFTIDQFAMNHPAGNIGKQISLKVSDLMLTGSKLPVCDEKTPLKEAIIELTNKRCGCILIKDQTQQMKGIFTDGDLRRALQKGNLQVFQKPMKDLMTKSYLFINQQSLVIEAIKLMHEDPDKRVMMLPVLQNQEIKGLICMHDIVHAGYSSVDK